MARLMKAENQVLVPDLKVANRFWSRLKGLLGTAHLPETEGLWIHRCNSIHTFFMKYPIDCVFVDSSLKVKALVPAVKPGRVVFPISGAESVIELKAGSLETLNLKVGDQLYVGP